MGSVIKELLDEICNLLNGCWFDTMSCVHHCSGDDCCPGGRPRTLERLIKLMRNFVFRHRPGAPSRTRWTKFAGALDFWLLSCRCHYVIMFLLSLAMSVELGLSAFPSLDDGDDAALKYCDSIVVRVAASTTAADGDDSELEDDAKMDNPGGFQELRSKRSSKFFRNMKRADMMLCILTYSVVATCVRFVNKFLAMATV